jgi:hypothetical protein
MPKVGFELTIPASERAKTVHALDRSATVTVAKALLQRPIGNVFREIISVCSENYENSIDTLRVQNGELFNTFNFMLS